MGTVLVLCGCDTLYGVDRRATLDSLPSLDCVRAVVSSTPGVATVRYDEHPGGKLLTLSGLKPEEPYYSFLYRGADLSHITGALEFHKDPNGAVQFSNSLQGINEIPTPEFVDASHPVMLEIERRLAERCGIKELPSRVTENCNQVAWAK